MDLPKQWRQDIRDFFKDPSGKEGVPFREIRLDPPMPWQDIHHEAQAQTKKKHNISSSFSNIMLS